MTSIEWIRRDLWLSTPWFHSVGYSNAKLRTLPLGSSQHPLRAYYQPVVRNHHSVIGTLLRNPFDRCEDVRRVY